MHIHDGVSCCHQLTVAVMGEVVAAAAQTPIQGARGKQMLLLLLLLMLLVLMLVVLVSIAVKKFGQGTTNGREEANREKDSFQVCC